MGIIVKTNSNRGDILKRGITKKFLPFALTLALILSNFFGIGRLPAVFGGTGTDEDPYTVAEAIAKQDNSVATVQGYIVGQPTAANKVITTGYSNDSAIAIADTAGETDTTKMLYVQIPSTPTSLRANYGLKTNPTIIGRFIKVTGNLTPYFTPHPGLKNSVSIVDANQAPVTPVTLTGLALQPSVATVEAGQTVKLAPVYNPADTTEKDITWSSSDITIAKVAVDGTVLGVKEGTVTITAASNAHTDITATATITVTAPADTDTTIAHARTKALNSTATVVGTVTRKSGNNYYIQDETAGICIYGTGLTFQIGDVVNVTGTLDQYGDSTPGDGKGILEIKPTSSQIISSENTVPAPKVLTISQIDESSECMLVEIDNVKIGALNTASNTLLTDSEGKSINIYKLSAFPDGVNAGDTVNVTAITSEYKGTYQLVVIDPFDIVKQADTVPPAITPTQVTDGNLSFDLKISAVITDNIGVSSAKLYYRTIGDTDYKSLAMALGENNTYSAVIPKASLTTKGIEYYIEASDGTNTVTSPADKTKPYQVTISDADLVGPEIKNMTPAAGECIASNIPTISAEYTDASGIDKSSVQLVIDTTDVTSKATITDSKISYTPETALANGKHTVTLKVYDNDSPLKQSSVMTWDFNVGLETYNTYFGMLHSHTNISDGQGSLDDAYTWVKNITDADKKVDFFAVTDHSNSFDNDMSCNMDDGSKSTKWTQAHSTADKYNEDGKFIAIYGYEMTWSGSTGGYGHINTFNTAGFETRNNSKMDLKTYYSTIAAHPASISQLNHPGTTFGDFVDFGYYSKAADDVVDLVEVGNGEGQVRGSGYFPSYNYYTRALDKGWHVAPSNNQDNHKGNWITANSARTVVLANNLTRDGIYDAIRAMRVYATEDSDLKIDYRINGKEMGSTLGKTDNLNFTINVSDPDAADKIAKISIIANGGVVVASKDGFNSNTADWNFTIAPQYDYYYVRVDEADKDIAVTAPLWTGDVLPYGFSNITSSLSLSPTNNPVDINAAFYNNGTSGVNDVKVEFFKNDMSDANKIGEAVISSIPGGSTGNAKLTWTPTAAGDYTIYAKTALNVNGINKVFSVSTKVSVKDEKYITKVVIDGAHQNQYITGNYPNKISELTNILNVRNCMVVVNTKPITADVLKDARLLILTDPQSTDNSTYNLTKSYYTDDEVAAIKAFVDAGGNIILTSKADYGDGTDIYSNGAQNNKVLEAIGTNLRVNDDEVIDNTTNGGQTYRLAFDKFTSSKYNLTHDVPAGETYSFFSGCSVILKPQGDASNVDYLVMGHDTTETLDSDNKGDSTPVTKGNVCVLAAEKLASSSKVIVAGSTFFSDFEMTGDNINANVPITNDILDWSLAGKPAELKSIADFRADANKDGKPDLLGQRFAIEGRVTAESAACGNKHSFFDCIYLQDDTAGITVFGVSTRKLQLGQKLRITGFVDQYLGDTEIQISNENTDIEIIDPTIENVMPKQMTTAQTMLEENEGWLVLTQGLVTKIDGQNLYIDDGSGTARVFLEGYVAGSDINNPGKWDSNIKVGSRVTAIGLASEDTDGHRIRVRNANEISLFKFPVEVTKISPETEFKLGQDAKVVVRGKNVTDKGQDMTLIIALFDSKTGKFLGYTASMQTIDPGKSVDLMGMMSLPKEGNLVIRCFVWDTLDPSGMNPLSDVIELPVN